MKNTSMWQENCHQYTIRILNLVTEVLTLTKFQTKISINMFQFVALLSIILAINQTYGSEAPKKVHLPVDNIREKFDVELQKIDPYLANENLPVYIIRDENPHRLEPLESMMESIGKFSMYHDLETSSAAVFFEKTNKFNGVIGVDYVIKDLLYIDGEDKLNPSGETLFPQIHTRLPWTHLSVFRRNKRGTENSAVPTDSLRRDVAYIEILVMVDSSMIQNNILRKSNRNDYKPVISHVLTVLNGVDMLYAKVKSPKIKINIAGIIIGERPGTFSFLVKEKCVEKLQKKFEEKILDLRSLEEICTARAVSTYFHYFQRDFKFRNSFDNIILFTGLSIHGYDSIEGKKEKKTVMLQGFYNDARWKDFEKQTHPIPVKMCVIRGERFFREYVTIAHELGHGFDMKKHDPEPYIDENGICCTYIMRAHGENCKKCLRWSPNTEEIFQSFFNSPESCIYLNEPKSLRTAPFRVMSATEQCQCYGFESSLELYREVLGMFRSDVCEMPLQCVDQSNHIVKPNHPMDGIPCGKKRVCWARMCRKIGS